MRTQQKILFLFLAASCVLGCSADNKESELANVVFLSDVHFPSPDANDLIATPGDYRLEADGQALRLVPLDGRTPLLLAAETAKHDEDVSEPMALVFSGITEEEQDLLYIGLLLPNGQVLDATGSASGIATRGWLKDKKDDFKRKAKRTSIGQSVMRVNRDVRDGIDNLATKGFEKDPGEEPDFEKLGSSPRIAVGMAGATFLELGTQVRIPVFRLQGGTCDTPYDLIDGSQGASDYGKCRIYYADKNRIGFVKLRHSVGQFRGHAKRSFTWFSRIFEMQKPGSADVALTLSATGRLQAKGSKSEASLVVNGLLESCRRPSADARICSSWIPVDTAEYSIGAVAGGGVEVGAGPIAINVGAGESVSIDDKIIFAWRNVKLRPNHQYRVQIRVTGEAKTGVRLATLPFGLFPTQVNFQRKVGSSEVRGIFWRDMTVWTYD